MIGVFPKGARFFRLPLTASHKTHGVGGSYHIEAKMIPTQRTQCNFSYLCQAWVPGSGLLYTFRIDQQIGNPRSARDRERVTTQVSRHLYGLSERTGLDYSMLYWADPARVDEYIKTNALEVH